MRMRYLGMLVDLHQGKSNQSHSSKTFIQLKNYSSTEDDTSFQTFDDFQNSLYAANPGLQPITVVRDNFVEQVL